MTRFDHLYAQALTLSRRVVRRSADNCETQAGQGIARARADGAILFRRPSRRIVAELTDLLVATPIILGLSVVVAKPWPKQSTPQTAAEQSATYGTLASLTPAEIDEALARVREGAKYSTRAKQNPIKLALVEGGSAIASGADAVASPQPAAIHSEGARTRVAEDGRLIVDGETIRLDGIVLPDAGATCRRLDGVEVRCLDRVAARLSIIMQHGALDCRTSVSASGERVGRCRAGKIDLAQDLVHARLARRASATQAERAPGA